MKRLHVCGAAIAALIFSGCGGASGGTEVNGTAPQNVAESDPLYPFEWHVHAPRSDFAARFGINAAAGIDAEPFWNHSRGAGVTIAVLDDYFQPSHPDLAGHVVAVFNAQTGGTDVAAPAGSTAHGQLCAGVAAAGLNGVGITGVAPDADLILIGSAFESDTEVIRAFEYARTQGADVISCSWGSYWVSEAVADEIRQVYEAGITVVFAAGNGNVNLDESYYNDESELPWVIGVGSSSEYNDRASYSNYGSALDCLAPGGEQIGLPATDLTGAYGFSPFSDALAAEYLGSDYAFLKGTSAAAPVVAGTAALIKSLRPDLSPDAVRQLIIDHAEKIGNASYDDTGFNPRYGYGKVNLNNIVSSLQ